MRYHYHYAVSNRGHRDLGIILAASGWLLMAFFFVFKEYYPIGDQSKIHFTSLFTRFTISHIFMSLFFLILCLLKNMGRHMRFKTMLKHSFKCEKFKYVILRALIAILSMYSLTFAIIWNDTVDNSILYITDAAWILIILWIAGVKINKISVIGIILATSIIFLTYFQNQQGGSFGGFIWGLVSGITLAIITVMTSYLVEFVPTRIIGLYHGITGIIVSLFLTIVCGIFEGFKPLLLSEIVGLAIYGITFSIALYSIIRALHYLETYVMGVMTFFFHASIEGIRFVYYQKVPSTTTIIGISILILAAIIILFSTELLPNKKKNLYKVSKN